MPLYAPKFRTAREISRIWLKLVCEFRNALPKQGQRKSLVEGCHGPFAEGAKPGQDPNGAGCKRQPSGCKLTSGASRTRGSKASGCKHQLSGCKLTVGRPSQIPLQNGFGIRIGQLRQPFGGGGFVALGEQQPGQALGGLRKTPFRPLPIPLRCLVHVRLNA